MFRIFPLSFAILQKKEGEGTDLVCSTKKGGYMLPPGRLTSRLRSRAFAWEYKPLVMGPPLSGCRGAAGRGVLLLAGWLFPFSLQFFACREENGHLLWQKGFFWARQGCVSFDRVLSVSLYQTPLQQKWGLCFVIFHLPSGRLILPFLPRSLGEQLATRCACPL